MNDKQLRLEILKKLDEVSDFFTDLTDDCRHYDDFEIGLDKAIDAMIKAKEQREGVNGKSES